MIIIIIIYYFIAISHSTSTTIHRWNYHAHLTFLHSSRSQRIQLQPLSQWLWHSAFKSTLTTTYSIYSRNHSLQWLCYKSSSKSSNFHYLSKVGEWNLPKKVYGVWRIGSESTYSHSYECVWRECKEERKFEEAGVHCNVGQYSSWCGGSGIHLEYVRSWYGWRGKKKDTTTTNVDCLFQL